MEGEGQALQRREQRSYRCTSRQWGMALGPADYCRSASLLTCSFRMSF